MKALLIGLWRFIYPLPDMHVDARVFDYYHRSVERQLHWSERTDLKVTNTIPHAPCK